MTDRSIALTLTALSIDVVAMLSSGAVNQQATIGRWSEYHGFEKATLSTPKVLQLLQEHGFPCESVQIELVKLTKPLAHEVHYHVHTHAHVVILDKSAGFRDPQDAFVFVRDQWLPALPGQHLDIPPEVVHGFTVSESGILDFLSIQTPPLVGSHRDDFTVVPCLIDP